jgi:hypothetical protein
MNRCLKIKNNKEKKDVVLICEKCGKKAMPDKKENGWDVFTSMQCECGGRLKFKLENE